MLFWTCKNAESTVELLGACSVCQLIAVICISRHACAKETKQPSRAHSSGGVEYYAAASTTSEAMLIREVLLFTGLDVLTELLLESASARGRCRREGVGTTRNLSTHILCLQQLVNRGVATVGASVHPQRTAQIWRQSHYLFTHTSTVDAVERLGVGPTWEFGDWRHRGWTRRERAVGETQRGWTRREWAAWSCSANNL